MGSLSVQTGTQRENSSSSHAVKNLPQRGTRNGKAFTWTQIAWEREGDHHTTTKLSGGDTRARKRRMIGFAWHRCQGVKTIKRLGRGDGVSREWVLYYHRREIARCEQRGQENKSILGAWSGRRRRPHYASEKGRDGLVTTHW